MDNESNNNTNNNIYNNYINNYNNYINNSNNGENALDSLIKDKVDNHIITFCSQIDQMLGGGVQLKKITEFCGIPGIGKTQMGFQLAVNVSIPFELGGVQGKSIYIDTEGSYSSQRIREMANHLVDHLKNISTSTTSPTAQQQPPSSPQPPPLTVENVLSNIYYYRVYHYIEMISLIHQLPLFLEKNKDVKLIVLDSITYPFRRDFLDMGLRTRSLLSLAQNLMNIATRYNLAVVVMNQVTTKISPNQKESILVPYLGESWSYICTYRMILFWKSKQRFCHLYKSPSFKSCFNPYEINEFGIRDLNYNIGNDGDNEQEDEEYDNNNNDNNNNSMFIG